jgi:hypothetical protein
VRVLVAFLLIWAVSAFKATGQSPGWDAVARHWAFQRLARPAEPQVEQADLCRTAVDAFVLAELEERGLSFSPDSDRTRLIRRAFIDLIGIPPTPVEINTLLQDTGADAYERLIDRLLESPQFGVRWARHWLDIVGYTDTISFDDDFGPPVGFTKGKWRYRDYVVNSLNEDKPYNQFLSEQIAGDEMVDWRGAAKYTPEVLEHLAATGYWRCCEDFSQEDPRPFIVWSVLHDTVTQLGTSVLGLSLNCARCHDHKFEPIPQVDYYRVMALFTPALNPADWRHPEQRAMPNVSAAEVAEIQEHNGQIDKQVAEKGASIDDIRRPHQQKLLENKLAQVDGTIRTAIKAALHVPADKRDDAQKELIAKHEPQFRIADEEMAAALGPADKEKIAELQKEIDRLNRERRSHDWIMGLTDIGKPAATRLLEQGDYLKPGEEVPPGFLSILTDDYADWLLKIPPKEDTSRRRMALARWLTDPQSRAAPLVARVMVNRVWQYLLGEGIVATPDNLGVSGSTPSHPELLDWLAAEFVHEDWRLKPLIRTIVTSSVYRQASFREDATRPHEVDPTNRLLWRARLRRIDAEVARDTMLAVSGKLDNTLGGPPVPLAYHPDGRVSIATEGLATPQSQWRRSLYLLNRRIYNPTFLSVFDKPVVTGSVCQRTNAAGPLQSLAMMNDELVIEYSRHFAHRVIELAPAGLDEQITLVFRLALSRAPEPKEKQWSHELVQEQAEIYRAAKTPDDEVAAAALAGLCQTVMSTNEFLYLE